MSSPYLIILFFYLIAGTAAAQVEPEIKVEYYQVTGSTKEDILKGLKRFGPKDARGRRFHGLTTWDLSWRYRNSNDGRTCRVTGATTYVTITTTLPKWTPSGAVDAELVKTWDRYINALTRHEEGHQRYGIEAAHEIDSRIAKMPGYPNCDLLEQAIRKIGDEVLAQAQAKSDRYDRQTRHGVSQGAIFP